MQLLKTRDIYQLLVDTEAAETVKHVYCRHTVLSCILPNLRFLLYFPLKRNNSIIEDTGIAF